MAHRRRRRRDDRELPGWIWMLFGLGLGLVVAVAVYMSGAGDDATLAPARPGSAATRPRPSPASAAEVPTARTPSAEPPPTDEDDDPAAPRFEFYDLLPRYEVVIPEVEGTLRTDRTQPGSEQPGLYVLQVGSFRELADADRRQAEIALLGIESRIQRVTIDDAVYHRVRIGPLTELAELNRIRAQLRARRIDSLAITVPD